MLVAEVIIPQMFTAYAEDLGYPGQNGLHRIQYFCEECDQAFMAAWGRKTGCLGYCERGDVFHCPHCGKEHSKNVVYVKSGEPAPYKMRLTVKEFKSVVVFEVVSKTAEFRDLLRVFEGKYKETFCFDIAKQTATFTYYKNGCEVESLDLGNPFKLDVLDKSILCSFQSFSLANQLQKTELSRILRVLRERVHRKLEKHLGYKVQSMYVSPGQWHGSFLLPIINIAYRLTFPDAPNLPAEYRESEKSIRRFWGMKMINDYNFMDKAVKLSKKGFISALLEASSLPDKPAIRRILTESPFDIGLLVEAFALYQNYDYAIRMYEKLKSTFTQSPPKPDLLKFLRDLLPIYGEAGTVHLMEATSTQELADHVRLYSYLPGDIHQVIREEQVRLKDLHDWLSWRYQIQCHPNYQFSVPDHIVKRLSMQTDRLKFFLPKESMELLEAGKMLHNCVASYGSAMKDNSKWIVLVAGDKGKLAACLEVKGRDLVQAKVDRNKPVASDAQLNAAVLAWAREAKLNIKTNDLKVGAEEKLSVAG